MSEPNWAKIIGYLYHSRTGRVEPPIYERGESHGVIRSHPFVEELDLSKKEAANALFQANEFGFIELKHHKEGIIKAENLKFDMFKKGSPELNSDLAEYALRLSNKGFDVAHDREQNKEQKSINKDIRNLTKIIALTAILQGLAAVFSVKLPHPLLITFIFVLVVIIIFLYDFI